MDLPDTDGNAQEFGYAGSGENRSAYPKARVVALAECGTHAFVAAEVDAWSVGEKTLAHRLYPRLNPEEVLTADRNFYSFTAWGLATETGAALLWRAPTGLALPVVEILPDGTYLTVLINPKIRGTGRRERLLAAAPARAELHPDEAHLARVVEYDVPMPWTATILNRAAPTPTSVRRGGAAGIGESTGRVQCVAVAGCPPITPGRCLDAMEHACS